MPFREPHFTAVVAAAALAPDLAVLPADATTVMWHSCCTARVPHAPVLLDDPWRSRSATVVLDRDATSARTPALPSALTLALMLGSAPLDWVMLVWKQHFRSATTLAITDRLEVSF